MPAGATPVPGYGNPNAKIVLIGEALGHDEVLLGEPFMGLAGKYLNKMLAEAGLERHNLYITNTVHCRPTKDDKGKANRPPKGPEIKACKTWAATEISEIEPKVVVTLGLIPTKAYIQRLRSTVKLDDIVGNQFVQDGISYLPNYHPAYLMGRRQDLTESAIAVFRAAKLLTESPNGRNGN
jgi:uracil-DNA glycosylase family 4